MSCSDQQVTRKNNTDFKKMMSPCISARYPTLVLYIKRTNTIETSYPHICIIYVYCKLIEGNYTYEWINELLANVRLLYLWVNVFLGALCSAWPSSVWAQSSLLIHYIMDTCVQFNPYKLYAMFWHTCPCRHMLFQIQPLLLCVVRHYIYGCFGVKRSSNFKWQDTDKDSDYGLII